MRRRGWSLVELIVVVAILALLLSLLLPALSGVTTSGRRTACLATVRSTAQAVHAYGRDWDEAVPGVPVSDATANQFGPDASLLRAHLRLPPSMGGGEVFMDYFHQAYFVNLLLEIGGVGPARTFTCPSHPEGELRLSSTSSAAFGTYTLPESFAADPRVFDATGGPVGPSDARTQRLHNVSHPSLKVLLFERRLYHERGWWSFSDAVERGVPVPTALADGHAVAARYPWPARATLNRLAGRPAYEPLATTRGVAGQDSWEAGG